MSSENVYSKSCACCGDFLGGAFSRRRFIGGTLAGAAAAVLTPGFAFAATGKYEAMVLGCIDPRLQEPVRNYAVKRDLNGKYSQFVIAGAAIGVVAEPFKDWHKAFWDNLATSIELHEIKSVIAINHRNCGAAKIAYGEESVAGRRIETETHRSSLAKFRKQVAERQPVLKVETGLMALNGEIEMFT